MTDTTTPGIPEGWAIVEIMGRRRFAGYLSHVDAGGHPMLRLDVPTDPAATQFYSWAAVYCVTPTTEGVVRAAVKAMDDVAPVSRWELPAAPAPSGGPPGHDLGDVPDDYEPWEDG